MKHKVLLGAMSGFLGAYTSRYSDSDGYWIFGFLVETAERLEIDLLNPTLNRTLSARESEAADIACRKFREQVEKHRYELSRIRRAKLMIARLPGEKRLQAQKHSLPGYDLEFTVAVTSERGKTFKAKEIVFVAPHDPRAERQSARGSPSDDT